MYLWDVTKVGYMDLEKTLQKIPPEWEVFAIVPSGMEFVVIIRRPK